MTLGKTRFWIDRGRNEFGIRSSSGDSQPFECWFNKHHRWLDLNFYESSNDSDEMELRFSFAFLWFTLNMLVCVLPARANARRFDDRDRKWGWSVLDRSIHLGWGEWRKFWGIPFITTECEGSQIMSLSRSRVVFADREGDGRRRDFLGTYKERQKAIDENSATFDYSYELNSGEKQQFKAKVHISRHLRRWKWTPFVKNDDSIWVEFSEEAGPERGSWKGGCTACGYTLRKNENVRECLRRMERERRFER